MKKTLIGVLIAGMFATGCRVEGLQFREDRTIEIIAPEDRATVSLPIVIKWKAEPGLNFGFFVDVIPQPPGEGLDYFFRKDPSCPTPQSCVAPEYLARVGVWRTSETEFTIENIGQRRGVSPDQKDWHEVTVALLDETGKRVGETGDWILLKLER